MIAAIQSPDASVGLFRQESLTKTPRTRLSDEIEPATHYVGIDPKGERVYLSVGTHYSLAYHTESQRDWFSHNGILDPQRFPNFPTRWTAVYYCNFNEPLVAGRIYTFMAKGPIAYYTGRLMGFDPQDNFVIRTLQNEILVLNRHRLSLTNTVRGHSIPEFHKSATYQIKSDIVALRVAGDIQAEGLYNIQGFTDDGDLIASPVTAIRKGSIFTADDPFKLTSEATVVVRRNQMKAYSWPERLFIRRPETYNSTHPEYTVRFTIKKWSQLP